jgi:hypothetical protein
MLLCCDANCPEADDQYGLFVCHPCDPHRIGFLRRPKGLRQNASMRRLTQLRYSATQRSVFACDSMVLADLLCTIFQREALKNRTPLKRSVPRFLSLLALSVSKG